MIEFPEYNGVVEWSDEDQCFIGSCPGIIGPCCHGDDAREVHRQLREIYNQWREIERDNEPHNRSRLP